VIFIIIIIITRALRKLQDYLTAASSNLQTKTVHSRHVASTTYYIELPSTRNWTTVHTA